MPKLDFKTVPDELLHIAVALEGYLIDHGYDVSIEQRELGFPFTPTILAKRVHETLIVELSSAIDQPRTEKWVKFSKSQSSDTRLCVAVAAEEAHQPASAAYCHQYRLGLWTYDGNSIIELKGPVDLAVQVELPDIKEMLPKLRPYLADPFKKISNGDWRDGLGDIYLAIEDRAREYLADGIARTRIRSVTKNGKLLDVGKIDAMTMGQLAVAFANITSQNQQDSIIANTLEMINPTRVKLTHKRLQKAAEEIIRKDVGKHVWAAINCLDEILK